MDPEGLAELLLELAAAGVRVLSPEDRSWVGSADGIVALLEAPGANGYHEELRHLGALAISDFVWLWAPGGYVGGLGALEVGYAHSAGVIVHSDTVLEDRALGGFVDVVENIDEAVLKARRRARLRGVVARHQSSYDAAAQVYQEHDTVQAPVVREAAATLARSLWAEARVLDVGCGTGQGLKALVAVGLDAEGIDVSHNMAEAARSASGCGVTCDDVLRTEAWQLYDGLMVLGFLQLYPKGETVYVLERLRRFLVPGGVLYVGGCSNDAAERAGDLSEHGEVGVKWRSLLSRDDVTFGLRAAGYDVIEELVVVDGDGTRWYDVVARSSTTR